MDYSDPIALPKCLKTLSPDHLLKSMQHAYTALHSCYCFQPIHLRQQNAFQATCILASCSSWTLKMKACMRHRMPQAAASTMHRPSNGRHKVWPGIPHVP